MAPPEQKQRPVMTFSRLEGTVRLSVARYLLRTFMPYATFILIKKNDAAGKTIFAVQNIFGTHLSKPNIKQQSIRRAMRISIRCALKLRLASLRAKSRIVARLLWRKHRPHILRGEWQRVKELVRHLDLRQSARAGLTQVRSVRLLLGMFDEGFVKTPQADVWTMLRRTRSAPAELPSSASVPWAVGAWLEPAAAALRARTFAARNAFTDKQNVRLAAMCAGLM